MTGDRRQETGDRRQETGDRRQETGDRRLSYCAENVNPENDKFNLVNPDFIYNRFDLWINCSDEELEKFNDFPFTCCINDKCKIETLHVNDENKDYYVQVLYKFDTAELGLWLVPITKNALKKIVNYIFSSHKEIFYIKYRGGYVPLGLSTEGNHFRIKLPDNKDELYNRLARKGRYNLNRSQKLLEKEFGTLSFNEYGGENIPEEIINKFTEMKLKTHPNSGYTTLEEWVTCYRVSNAYTMSCDNKIIAVILANEQCQCVFLQNITYDIEYSQYSPGMLLYCHFLEELIKKGKKELFTGGGTLEYKRRFGAEEETFYRCIIYRRLSDKIKKQYYIILMRCVRLALKKILPVKLFNFIKNKVLPKKLADKLKHSL